MKTPGTTDLPTVIGQAASARNLQVLALTPLLVFSHSAAISLGVGILLCCMAMGGKALSLLSLRLSFAVNGSRQGARAMNPSVISCLFFVIYALWAAIVIAVIDTTHFAFSRALGSYLYLIVCSAYLLAEARSLHGLDLSGYPFFVPRTAADSDATTPALLPEWIALLRPLSYYVLLLVGFAMVREGLYTGSMMRDWQLLLPFTVSAENVAIYSRAQQLVPMAGMIPGGFILLGLFIALLRLAGQRFNTEFRLFSPEPTASPGSAKRARVTEKL
jgi:hypothetical protein